MVLSSPLEPQRMLIRKLEKQVEEYLAAPLSNGTSLSEGGRLLKRIHGFENKNNPGIYHFKFFVGDFLDPQTEFSSCPVSLSLSKGHLGIKLYPYHFQVIMMHEPVR